MLFNILTYILNKLIYLLKNLFMKKYLSSISTLFHQFYSSATVQAQDFQGKPIIIQVQNEFGKLGCSDE